MTGSDLAVLRLKARADQRLRQGHCWIYSNEIDTAKTPFRDLVPGQQVTIESAGGKPMGVAYINPQNLICGRLVSSDTQYCLNESLLRHRFNIALSWREQAFDEPFYRLVYGESDGLPGLVVDRFDDTLVVQLNTAGMEAVKDDVVAALVHCIKPARILLKNDSNARKQEGLEKEVKWVFGDPVEELTVKENGATFVVSAESGQKTGWFYDHRISRQRMQSWVEGKRVLDVFSYVGGWGIQAATAGAASVCCVDSSQAALDYVERNAELNGVADKVSTAQGSAFDVMEALHAAGERYDVVIVDPPAFIKRRKDSRAGTQAYKKVNQQAMRLLDREGVLISASCSMHFSRPELVETLRAASRHVERNLQIFDFGGQGPDHPVHPAIVETEYLKTAFCRVTSS